MTADENAKERGRRAIDFIVRSGAARGLEVATEYPVEGGRIDVVWLWSPPAPVPGVSGPLPIAGFEVESSWRTRKHLKGDFLNLADLAPAVGVIVLLGHGQEVEATRVFARTMVDRPGVRILVWTEDELQRLETTPSGRSPADETRWPGNFAPPIDHAGKYRALWAWLADQPTDMLTATFRQIEEVIGMPLPPSCRRHAAHWSGHGGSAVARAIRDAGFRAVDVNLAEERVSFVRDR